MSLSDRNNVAGRPGWRWGLGLTHGDGTVTYTLYHDEMIPVEFTWDSRSPDSTKLRAAHAAIDKAVEEITTVGKREEDRLPLIKNNLANLEYERHGSTREDVAWLIAEVERLRGINRHDEELKYELEATLATFITMRDRSR